MALIRSVLEPTVRAAAQALPGSSGTSYEELQIYDGVSFVAAEIHDGEGYQQVEIRSASFTAAPLAASQPGELSLTSSAEISVTEGQAITIPVQRQNGTDGEVSADVVISPASLVTAATDTVTFPAGSGSNQDASFTADQDGTGTATLTDGGALNGATIVTPSVRNVTVTQTGGRYSVNDALLDWEGGWTQIQAPAVPTNLPAPVALTPGTINYNTLADSSSKHYILGPGVYMDGANNFDIGGADVLIELQAGAQLGIVRQVDGCTRGVLRGETPRPAGSLIHGMTKISGATVTDFLLDGLNIDATVLGLTQADNGNMFGSGNRLAMISCYMNAVRSGLYAGGSPATCSDLIVANCLMERSSVEATGTHAFRFMGWERAMILDTMADWAINGSLLRIHASSTGDSNDILVKRVHSEGSAGMQIRGSGNGVTEIGDNGNTVGRVKLVDSTFYRNGGNVSGPNDLGLGFSPGDAAAIIELENLAAYSTSSGWTSHFVDGSQPVGWSSDILVDTQGFNAYTPVNKGAFVFQ